MVIDRGMWPSKLAIVFFHFWCLNVARGDFDENAAYSTVTEIRSLLESAWMICNTQAVAARVGLTYNTSSQSVDFESLRALTFSQIASADSLVLSIGTGFNSSGQVLKYLGNGSVVSGHVLGYAVTDTQDLTHVEDVGAPCQISCDAALKPCGCFWLANPTNGKAATLLVPATSYQFRTRPWFANAFDEKTRTWTDIYIMVCISVRLFRCFVIKLCIITGV